MNNAQLVIDEVKKAVKGKDDCRPIGQNVLIETAFSP